MSDEPREISADWWAQLDGEITSVKAGLMIKAGQSMMAAAACDFFGVDQPLTIRQAGAMRRALDSMADKERFAVQLVREYLQAGKSTDFEITASGPSEWAELAEWKRRCLDNYALFLLDSYNADGTLMAVK